jgi:aldose 1-epimerase
VEPHADVEENKNMTAPILRQDQSSETASTTPVTIQCASWGTASNGESIHLYTLDDGKVRVQLTNLGAGVVSLVTPDRAGVQADIVLGYNTPAAYEAETETYMGATVGRYANRLAKGTFTLDGQTFHVPLNNGPNAIHGGLVGFDRKVWRACIVTDGVEMSLLSEDGDMGFPGALDVRVRYSLSNGALAIDYTATTTKPTVVNLTHHSYFNLAGENSGSILDHIIRINADRYTVVNSDKIPSGELASVANTPLDLRQPIAIGEGIAGGFDHNFVLNGAESTTLRWAAEVHSPTSGRLLRVETTEPGVQFYSGIFLDGRFVGKSGQPYHQHAGFCLETQHLPDSPNQPSFPSTVLRPSETLRSTTIFSFGLVE